MQAEPTLIDEMKWESAKDDDVILVVASFRESQCPHKNILSRTRNLKACLHCLTCTKNSRQFVKTLDISLLCLLAHVYTVQVLMQVVLICRRHKSSSIWSQQVPESLKTLFYVFDIISKLKVSHIAKNMQMRRNSGQYWDKKNIKKTYIVSKI